MFDGETVVAEIPVEALTNAPVRYPEQRTGLLSKTAPGSRMTSLPEDLNSVLLKLCHPPILPAKSGYTANMTIR